MSDDAKSFSEELARDFNRLAERGKALGIAMGLTEAAEVVSDMAGRITYPVTHPTSQGLNDAAQRLAKLAADRLAALDDGK